MVHVHHNVQCIVGMAKCVTAVPQMVEHSRMKCCIRAIEM